LTGENLLEHDGGDSWQDWPTDVELIEERAKVIYKERKAQRQSVTTTVDSDGPGIPEDQKKKKARSRRTVPDWEKEKGHGPLSIGRR